MKYGNEYTLGDVTLYRVGNRWIQAGYDERSASWHTYDVRLGGHQADRILGYTSTTTLGGVE